MEDHAYQMTLAGRCQRCGNPQAAHPAFRRTEGGECSVDHRSIATKRLIGDEGEEWSRCPVCGVQVEPKLDDEISETAKRRRSSYGRGRMPFTQRHMDELAKMKAAFEGGYFQS